MYVLTPKQWIAVCERSNELEPKYRAEGRTFPVGDSLREAIRLLKLEDSQPEPREPAVLKKPASRQDKALKPKLFGATMGRQLGATGATIRGDSEKRKAQKRAWKLKNAEKIKAQKRRYYLKRKELEL